MVRLSKTVEVLVGDAVVVTLNTDDVVSELVEVVFWAKGELVVVFKASWEIEDERDAEAVIVALSSDEVD